MRTAQLRSLLDIVSTLVVILVGAALGWRMWSPPSSLPLSNPRSRPVVEAVAGLTVPAGVLGNTRGTGDIVLIEFADYQCPYCARHARDTAPRIVRELVATGQVTEVFAHFPLDNHPQAQKASEAAQCAQRQGRFWDMHEQVLANATALDPSDFVHHAAGLGLDTQLFADCLEKGAAAGDVKTHAELGRRLGVNATPAFFVGKKDDAGDIHLVRRINGAVPFSLFEQAVRDVASLQRDATVGE